MSQGLRERFWEEAKGILEEHWAWSERFEALEALVAKHRGGLDLVDSPPLAGSESPDALCAPLPPHIVGYRAFLKEWTSGEQTLIHGHPSTMFVYPVSTRLECIDYSMVEGRPVVEGRRIYGPTETMVGAADNDRHDNFVHSLRCVEAGWSLHIYSDSGARGPRFDLDGTRLIAPSSP
jgi:hypothetical protein